MKKIFIVLVLLYGSNALAGCARVSCSPEGVLGEQQVRANVSAQSSRINQKLNSLKEKTQEEQRLLDDILKKQAEYIRLTSMKQVYLKYLTENSSNLTHLVRSQEQ